MGRRSHPPFDVFWSPKAAVSSDRLTSVLKCTIIAVRQRKFDQNQFAQSRAQFLGNVRFWAQRVRGRVPAGAEANEGLSPLLPRTVSAQRSRRAAANVFKAHWHY